MVQAPPKRTPEPSKPEILPMASDPCAEGTVVKAAEAPPEFLFSSLNPPPAQSRDWHKYAFVAAAVVVLAVGAWMLHRMSGRAAKERAAVSAPPASVENVSVPSPAPPAPEPVAKAVVPEPPKATAPASGDTAKAKDSKTTEKNSKTAEKDSKTAEKERKSGESAAAKAEKAEVLMVKPSSARPNATPEEIDVAPPAATFASAKTPPMVSVSKPYIPNAPALKTAELIPPQLIKSVPPAYPEVAKRNRFQSTVVLNARITKDGTLDQIQVVRGMTIFHPAAINAVRQWRYKPAYLDGQPVDSTIEIKMEFTAR
jgi:protein TonB